MTENIWTVLGQEFGEDAGRKAIVVRNPYGLKSAGDDFSKSFDRLHAPFGILVMSC